MSVDKLIFLDESGEICFSAESTQDIFIIACLVIDGPMYKKIKNVLRNKNAKLIKLGWPKRKEVKANSLHRLSFDKELIREVGFTLDGDAFIEGVLESLTNACKPELFFVAVNKEKIESVTLRSAPYGIAYNYFAKIPIMRIVTEPGNYRLIVDQRNKETHRLKSFNEYVKTVVLDYSLEKSLHIVFSVEQLQSHTIYGLQAVDYYCWAINRLISFNETRFYAHFEKCIGAQKRWYC